MKNKTFIICLIFWILITLFRVIFHQPWHDEALAWLYAEKLSFLQLFQLSHTEGHFFVWFTMLMPFAKSSFLYPYSMLILNWVCCLVAIIVLWKKAPFNNFLKVAISFSFPFFAYYPVVARCYSVGIFLLFILTALFKEKIKYPIIYALLIILCANTSSMALLGAMFFAITLIIDLVKNKQNKDLISCSVLGLFCVGLICAQIFPVNMVNVPYEKTLGLELDFFNRVFVFSPVVNLILLVLYCVGFIYALFKDKLAMSLIVFSYFSLLYIFEFWYAGDFWHYYFFYVYLIISCWIALENNAIKDFNKKMISWLLITLSLLFVVENRYEPRVFNSKSKEVANYMQSLENSRLIFFSPIFMMSTPYLDKDSDIYYYTYNAGTNELSFANIKNSLAVGKENYGFFNHCEKISEFDNKNEKIVFENYKNFDNRYCVYKVKLIK